MRILFLFEDISSDLQTRLGIDASCWSIKIIHCIDNWVYIHFMSVTSAIPSTLLMLHSWNDSMLNCQYTFLWCMIFYEEWNKLWWVWGADNAFVGENLKIYILIQYFRCGQYECRDNKLVDLSEHIRFIHSHIFLWPYATNLIKIQKNIW